LKKRRSKQSRRFVANGAKLRIRKPAIAKKKIKMKTSYRREFWNFKTKKGIEKKCVVVLAGKDERKRLLAKAAEMERLNGWKLL
jgi:hypothetical protein